MAVKASELKTIVKENKSVVLIILLGLILLLLPTGSKDADTGGAEYTDEEQKLAEVLSEVRGVGECRVLLQQSGKNQVDGALVVCRGAGSAEVCLAVKKAVAAYTGLGSNRITILESKQGGN